jgi:hypothetical protein
MDKVGGHFGDQVADLVEGQGDQLLMLGLVSVAFAGGNRGEDRVGMDDQGCNAFDADAVAGPADRRKHGGDLISALPADSKAGGGSTALATGSA